MTPEDERQSIVSVELDIQYARRFAKEENYRKAVWSILVQQFFQRIVPVGARVLDLGCGYAQFINAVEAKTKYAMDLNPRARDLVKPDVTFFLSDCSERWPLEDDSLDVVFTSNFLEHLPDKAALRRTMLEAARCLVSGGTIVCLGPNIRFLAGEYWDFWDHHVPLSDRSLREILELSGFRVESCLPRFLPYTMATGKNPPLAFVRAYLRVPFAWPIFGRQFLLIAKNGNESP
jgi:SAM-dependent methyltransferase